MTPPRPGRAPLYLVNAAVDGLCLGGASLAAYGLLWLKGGVSAQAAATFSLWSLSWIVNGLHFSATNFRLYHSRENRRQYPLTAFLLPVLVMAGVWASLSRPEDIAPYFVKLFLLWSPYHYSGQTLGLTLLYCRRAGYPVGRAERLALAGFIFGSYLASVAAAESGLGRADYFGVRYPSLGLPPWTAGLCSAGMWACAALFLALALRWCLANKRGLPPVVFLPAAAQFVWFIPGPRLGAFYEFVPFFHGLQYLLVAWFMQIQERIGQDGVRLSERALALESLRWGLWNLAGYAALFWLFPQALAGAWGAPLSLAAPVAIAAVQIHHFFVDGVIWKLKSPAVGPPLLAGLDELLEGSAGRGRA